LPGSNFGTICVPFGEGLTFRVSGKKMRSLLLCLSRTDTEAFCQTELFVFANCKFERVRRSPTRALFQLVKPKKTGPDVEEEHRQLVEEGGPQHVVC